MLVLYLFYFSAVSVSVSPDILLFSVASGRLRWTNSGFSWNLSTSTCSSDCKDYKKWRVSQCVRREWAGAGKNDDLFVLAVL